MNTEDTTEAVVVLQEWRDENGRVDLDAVREVLECGDPIDNNVEHAILDLLEEVEELRRRINELASMQDRIPDDENGDWGLGWDGGYNAALAETRAIAEGGGWMVRMYDGEMGPYPTWRRAVEAARGPLAPGVTRIDGPAGTVPLVGSELAAALKGGAR